MSDKEWTDLMLHIVWLSYQLEKECLNNGKTREWIKAKIRKDILATKTPSSEITKMLAVLGVNVPDVTAEVNIVKPLNLI